MQIVINAYRIIGYKEYSLEQNPFLAFHNALNYFTLLHYKLKSLLFHSNTLTDSNVPGHR